MVPTSEDAALGAVLGAFVGDAAGAVVEFESNLSRAQVERAMKMPGGGCFRVGPGQITDDSELALCLGMGLLESTPPNLPLYSICQYYKQWYDSSPFDIGMATRSALGAASGRNSKPTKSVPDAMMEAAASSNSASKANGALMRSTPLAVWGHKLAAQDLAECAAADARVTHPNDSCQECNAAYCIAIAHLICHPGDAEGAITAASTWLKAKNPYGEAATWLQQACVSDRDPIGDPEALSSRTIGFVRWAYTLAFYHLHHHSSYTEAIFDTLMRCGDTDTNAAIVGGLVGALHGAAAIPDSMKQPVLARVSEDSPGQQRPLFLQSGQAVELATNLYQMGSSYEGGPVSIVTTSTT